ncbi:hypothetical protein [Chryseolinea lacunae]|uniref:Baseplate protein J-like domain-containing protein n=1 Tax=Chryseolinea lacunae TaxID=2801331 RepID=A0ABS1KS58_9BACT|nr:hypothetical protein [Chryseolinea lacunae]MBL0741126.1 hypothetical protein [Chryseolinea lacunae]
MEELATIPKNTQRPLSQDYERLREAGLKHIEALGHALWTDYNAHDPGITILEALCYAMTEGGYRNGFVMRDLLTKSDGKTVDDQVFFTAKKILTNNPLTINDYRKLLIDIEGVHNAWLFAESALKNEQGIPVPVNEVPIYANCKNDVLQYEPTPVTLFLSGLYRVLLDLDNDTVYGDLNNGEVIFENPALLGKFARGDFWFDAELPAWKSADFEFATKAKDKNNIASTTVVDNAGTWVVTTVLTDSTSVTFTISLSKKPSSGTVTTADVQTMLTDSDYVASLFNFYLEKITKSQFIVHTAIRTLHEHRNLCEDFMSVTTVDDEEIAFCFDVDVKPSADIEKVQAEMFYAIENYLNPSVDFYSLKELLEKKIPVDEIFEGVVLQHGFINSTQLEATQLRSVIHTSDIINLLMDIDGVIAIRNFVMTKYGNDGKPVPGFIGLKWCMNVTALHKPVLSTARSKILLFKNQFPFIARYDEVHDTVSMLHAQRSRAKLNGLQDDLPVPTGAKRNTESYWPVQYDFPQTYGINEAGLPAHATPQRIAQQRQLKGYLMFFEQLLADFISQLTNAHKLFSTDTITHTYYAQFLEDIKDIAPVYAMDGPVVKLKDAIVNADATVAKNRWQQLYEPRDLFEDRRGRFLDHLLARFAESFNDYALLMYTINYSEQTEEKIDFAEIAGAKIRTLKAYDDISSNRGKAFNYFPQKNDFTVDVTRLWDTDNVSGLEKRISFLTGIKDFTRRFLYCIKNIEVICTEKTITENGESKLRCFHSFSLTTLTGVRLVSKDYEQKSDAEDAVKKVIETGSETSNYSIQPAGANFIIVLGDLLTSEGTFSSALAAQQAIDALAQEMKTPCNDPVGLHLIEHILLRPRPVTPPAKTFDLMQVCLDGCDCPCELDPYTFRASVVLPYWPQHFDNMAFRAYFENKIREEAPAHVQLRICWLNNDLLREFEIRYKKWIEMLAAYAFDKETTVDAFREANDNMLDILTHLHSEYPLATLHDCDESKEGSNTVVLGKTVLGTFKNL